MSLPDNIDLTSGRDFSKQDPLKVKVNNFNIEHPRIPWKINKFKSPLSKYYKIDSFYSFPDITSTTDNNLMININDNYLYTNSSFTNSHWNNSATYNIYHGGFIYTNNDGSFSDIDINISSTGQITYKTNSSAEKDIFGCIKKYKSDFDRIPFELKSKRIHLSSDKRVPESIKRSKYKWLLKQESDYCDPIPEEFFYRNDIDIKYSKNSRSRIPWIKPNYHDEDDKYLRLTRRSTERGIVL